MEKKDNYYFKRVKLARTDILAQKDKPILISPSSIRNQLAIGTWLHHPEMKEIKEDIADCRIRKIKWAIEAIIEEDITLIPYKIQIYAGFSGGDEEI